MNDSISEHLEIIKQLNYQSIERMANKIIEALENGNKVFVFGNGGSAADAQHFVAEMVGKFKIEREPLPFIALTTNTSVLTSIANDYTFEDIFARQIEALAEEGDVAIGLSTSGKSKNVQKGMEMANSMGCNTIGLLGENEGIVGPTCNYSITVKSKNTPRIQEAHILIIHLVCDEIEKRLFGE